MVVVTGIVKGFLQVGVAPGASAVFGWAGTLAGKAGGDLRFGVGIETFLEHEVVLPAVAEVIRVLDVVARLLEELAQPGISLVSEPEFGVGDSVVAGGCGEHVQVGIGPAHRGLDDVVQPVKAHVRRDEQPAPDRGLGYAAQAELELHRRF